MPPDLAAALAAVDRELEASRALAARWRALGLRASLLTLGPEDRERAISAALYARSARKDNP
jgi:hypothetical protein